MRLAIFATVFLLLGAGDAQADREETERTCVSNQLCLTNYERDVRADGDCEYGGDAQGRPQFYEHTFLVVVASVPLTLYLSTNCHSDKGYVNRHVVLTVMHQSNLGFELVGAEWYTDESPGKECGVRAWGTGGAATNLGFRRVACPTYLEPPMLPPLP